MKRDTVLILEEINFGEFGILIAICQIKTRHFIPLCACSMAHGHKFDKLKPANHQFAKISPLQITCYTVHVHVL